MGLEKEYRDLFMKQFSDFFGKPIPKLRKKDLTVALVECMAKFMQCCMAESYSRPDSECTPDSFALHFFSHAINQFKGFGGAKLFYIMCFDNEKFVPIAKARERKKRSENEIRLKHNRKERLKPEEKTKEEEEEKKEKEIASFLHNTQIENNQIVFSEDIKEEHKEVMISRFSYLSMSKMFKPHIYCANRSLRGILISYLIRWLSSNFSKLFLSVNNQAVLLFDYHESGPVWFSSKYPNGVTVSSMKNQIGEADMKIEFHATRLMESFMCNPRIKDRDSMFNLIVDANDSDLLIIVLLLLMKFYQRHKKVLPDQMYERLNLLLSHTRSSFKLDDNVDFIDMKGLFFHLYPQKIVLQFLCAAFRETDYPKLITKGIGTSFVYDFFSKSRFVSNLSLDLSFPDKEDAGDEDETSSILRKRDIQITSMDFLQFALLVHIIFAHRFPPSKDVSIEQISFCSCVGLLEHCKYCKGKLVVRPNSMKQTNISTIFSSQKKKSVAPVFSDISEENMSATTVSEALSPYNQPLPEKKQPENNSFFFYIPHSENVSPDWFVKVISYIRNHYISDAGQSKIQEPDVLYGEFSNLKFLFSYWLFCQQTYTQDPDSPELDPLYLRYLELSLEKEFDEWGFIQPSKKPKNYNL